MYRRPIIVTDRVKYLVCQKLWVKHANQLNQLADRIILHGTETNSERWKYASHKCCLEKFEKVEVKVEEMHEVLHAV